MTTDELNLARIARAREAFSLVPYAKLLGLELGQVTDGVLSLHLDVREEIKQYQGVVHGGAVASLIDTAAAFAVITRLDLDEHASTADLTIHYLRPATSGRLTAKARVVRSGRRLLVLTVEVTDESQILIATAVTTYIKLQ
jgi:acyl-CoA thioesterase